MVSGRTYRVEVRAASGSIVAFSLAQDAAAFVEVGGDVVRSGSGPDGSGYSVAVIDTGIDASSPSLSGRVIVGPDFGDASLGGGQGSGVDPVGHGTAVAGVIASSNPLAPGLAPGSDVIALKVTRRAPRLWPTSAPSSRPCNG